MNRRTFLASSTAALAATAFPLTAFAGSKSGSFVGQSNHVTKGGVTVNGSNIQLESSFWFDGAPDPRVGLGKNGKFIAFLDQSHGNTGNRSL